ncbi:hypothetical protein OXX80_000910 [Metschnikowia pulcherrima]
MRIYLTAIVIALIANEIRATSVESRENEPFGVTERGQSRLPLVTLHGRLVYGRFPLLHFTKDPSPAEITQQVITSLRNFVRELKGFISPDTFRFVLFQRMAEHFGSTLRELEGVLKLGEHSEEAQQRLVYSKTLYLTMTRAAINMRRFLPSKDTGNIAVSHMSLIQLKALALYDSRGEFHTTLAHSVRRLMCLKQDVNSWEAVFNSQRNVHFLTKLIFTDLVGKTRAQIKALENKIPRDREFWSQEGQPRDGDFFCLA